MRVHGIRADTWMFTERVHRCSHCRRYYVSREQLLQEISGREVSALDTEERRQQRLHERRMWHDKQLTKKAPLAKGEDNDK